MIDQTIEQAIDAWIADHCNKYGVNYPPQCWLRSIPVCIRDGEKGESDRVRMVAAYIAGKGVSLDHIAMLSDHKGFLTVYFRHWVKHERETLRIVAEAWEWLGEEAACVGCEHVHKLVLADRVPKARTDYDHAYARLLAAAVDMARAYDFAQFAQWDEDENLNAYLGGVFDEADVPTIGDRWAEAPERQRGHILVEVAKRLSDGGRSYIATLEAALDLAQSEPPPRRKRAPHALSAIPLQGIAD